MLDTIAQFRSLQIPASYCAAPAKSAFAQTANCTKMFHVKHFGTIRATNTRILHDEVLRSLQAFETGSTNPRGSADAYRISTIPMNV